MASIGEISREELAQQVAQRFARFVSTPVEEVRPLSGGAANTSHLVRTADGECYVLTLCDEKTGAQVDVLARCYDLLAAHGLPTPRLVRDGAGQAVHDVDGVPLLCKRHLPGRVVERPSHRELGELGAALAALHAVPAPDWLPDGVPYVRDLFEPLGVEWPEHPFVDWLREQSAALAPDFGPNAPRRRVVLAHGDLFFDNVLFDGERLSGLLDFEEVCRAPRVLDVGTSALGCALLPGWRAEGRLDHAALAALLEGYGPLEQWERALLASAIRVAAVATALWRFRQFRLRRPTPEMTDHHRELVLLAQALEGAAPPRAGALPHV